MMKENSFECVKLNEVMSPSKDVADVAEIAVLKEDPQETLSALDINFFEADASEHNLQDFW